MFSVHFGVHICIHCCKDFCLSCQNHLCQTLHIWDKEYIGLGKYTGWLIMTLTQGHSCGIDQQKFACLHDKVRTTLLITTKLGSFISLVMLITWLDFGVYKFCWKFFFAISQEKLVWLMWNDKEMHQLDTGYTVWPWPLTSLMTLSLDFSKSNFETAVSQELLV